MSFLYDDSRSPLQRVDFERRPGRQLYALGRFMMFWAPPRAPVESMRISVRSDKRCAPTGRYFVLAPPRTHAPHGGSLFLFGHLQRMMDGVGELRTRRRD